MDPQERSLRARLAAHTSWANTPDPASRTAKARKAALDRFEKQVDPDGVLTAEDRARRAEHARKAYFIGLALRSAQARRIKRRRSTTSNAATSSISASASSYGRAGTGSPPQPPALSPTTNPTERRGGT